jgi:arabinan endo-1,5-alpha-L-arabinosidase
MAPDIIQLGDRYCMYVAANIGAQPRAAINLIWNRTLDPNSPDYKWEEAGVVASSDEPTAPACPILTAPLSAWRVRI